MKLNRILLLWLVATLVKDTPNARHHPPHTEHRDDQMLRMKATLFGRYRPLLDVSQAARLRTSTLYVS